VCHLCVPFVPLCPHVSPVCPCLSPESPRVTPVTHIPVCPHVPSCPQLSPAVLNCPRLSPDINELNLPKTCEIDFSDQDDLLHFRLLICPDEVGLSPVSPPVTSLSPVGQGYPHDPPKVKCETMVYHPNIDLEGNVCLNILRWAT
ncbi:UBC12 enzyme, partial [Struthidea cinerea]|nr:UBC12 enzyme [Struthidea cinerea]